MEGVHPNGRTLRLRRAIERHELSRFHRSPTNGLGKDSTRRAVGAPLDSQVQVSRSGGVDHRAPRLGGSGLDISQDHVVERIGADQGRRRLDQPVRGKSRAPRLQKDRILHAISEDGACKRRATKRHDRDEQTGQEEQSAPGVRTAEGSRSVQAIAMNTEIETTTSSRPRSCGDRLLNEPYLPRGAGRLRRFER